MFVYMSMCIYLCVYINIMFCLCVQFVMRLIWLLFAIVYLGFHLFLSCLACIYRSKSVNLCLDNLCALFSTDDTLWSSWR